MLDNTVTKLARDGKVLGTFPVGEGPVALAFDRNNLWAANSGLGPSGEETTENGTVTKLAVDGTRLGEFLWVGSQ